MYLICLWEVSAFIRDKREEYPHENSVVFVDVYFSSIAVKTGVGTQYSAMKFPFVSLTLPVLPRLMVCRRRHMVLMPLVGVDKTESVRE